MPPENFEKIDPSYCACFLRYGVVRNHHEWWQLSKKWSTAWKGRAESFDLPQQSLFTFYPAQLSCHTWTIIPIFYGFQDGPARYSQRRPSEGKECSLWGPRACMHKEHMKKTWPIFFSARGEDFAVLPSQSMDAAYPRPVWLWARGGLIDLYATNVMEMAPILLSVTTTFL